MLTLKIMFDEMLLKLVSGNGFENVSCSMPTALSGHTLLYGKLNGEVVIMQEFIGWFT